MNFTLQNQFIKAGFSTHGAELQQLIHRDNNVNYLWRGDTAIWGKFSPILFPIVGALRNNTYHFNANTYTLPRHGFARDSNFEAVQLSETELMFFLKADSRTKGNYPFDFKLSVGYQLVDNSLKCTYEVENQSQSERLYFSLGAHPAFAVPLNHQEQYEDYYLQFSNDNHLESFIIQDNLLTTQTFSVELKDRCLPLSRQLFTNDALVFKSLKSKQIFIRNKVNNSYLDFAFEGFDYFGVWAAPNGDFVCLEPWAGIADGLHHNQQLEEKEGVVALGPELKWNAQWQVTLQ